MKNTIYLASVLFLVGCISSKDYTESFEAKNMLDTCYELSEATFVFESRCADIEGNNNSTICLSVQVAGKGGFPQDLRSYSKSSEAIDTQLFDRLAFEDQRHILFLADAGTKVKLKRLVHHGWGTVGQYWIVRGSLEHEGRQYEIELPSLDFIHKAPFWFDARANKMPNEASIQFLRPAVSCL